MKISKDFLKCLPILITFILGYIIITFILDRINENNVENLTNTFLENVGKNNPEETANLFCKDGILLATVSKIKRRNNKIREYFNYFANLPNIHVVEKNYSIVKISSNVYVNNAFVTLSWDNLPTPVTARMTFIFRGNCIFQLHSSGLPELNENLYLISGNI